MSDYRRNNKYAFAEGSTWGTAVSLGALDGFYPQEGIDGGYLEYANAIDRGAGQGQECNSQLGNQLERDISMDLWAYENDNKALQILAGFFGEDTVTGAADPYSHAGDFQNESGKFFTFGFDEANNVQIIPSAKITDLTLMHDQDGILHFDVSAKADTVAVGGGTALDTVTYKAISQAFRLQDFVLRMNAQSGDALDADDKVGVVDFNVNLTRAVETFVTSNGSKISEPTEGAFPENIITFTIPLLSDTLAGTLESAYKNETAFKCDATWGGSTADRELVIEFPQIIITKFEKPQDEVTPAIIEARIQKASAAPTGMTSEYMNYAWKCDESASVLA